MSRFAIPLLVTPSQTLTVQLGRQSCRIAVRQRRTGLFVDLYLQDVPIVQGVKALDRVRIVRDAYLDFMGDLYFVDTQGTADPSFDGFGGRFVLVWDDVI